MEFTMISFLVLSFFSLLFIRLLFFSKPANKNGPPSPPSLPFLGHLHLLKKPLHHTLAHLSSLYSAPALLLRFGSRPVLVISSLSLAEECFTKNDIVFANRPQFPSSKGLTYNYTTLVSAPYGPHWRRIRRLATVELLSASRLQSLSNIRYDEVRSLMCNLLREFDGEYSKFKKVELKPRLFGLALNMMMRMIAGKRYYGEDAKESEEATRFRKMVKEALALVGASNVSDFLPVLRLVDFQGLQKRMRRVEAQREVILQRMIDEERRNKREESKNKTMIEVLLSLQQEEPEHYTDDIIKALIMTLLIAGTDSSTETIEWAMSLLLNHPEALLKARDEIDANIPMGRLLEEDNLPNLPYLHAIINETMRLHPAGPLLGPHESREECTVGGYVVPTGTILLVNAWAIHRDPAIWADPLEFRPERFLAGEESGSVKIIPFGMGRRSCAGELLAMRLVSLVLGTMIQCFEWERVGEELVDMAEGAGITVPRLIPLEAMYRPRETMIGVISQAHSS